MNPFKPIIKDPIPKQDKRDPTQDPKLDPVTVLEPEQKVSPTPQTTNGRLELLIILVIIVSLVWGLVGSLEMLIVSIVQGVFPTRTKFQYAVLQIFIYVILLAIIIYITDIDITNLFISTDHLKLSE